MDQAKTDKIDKFVKAINKDQGDNAIYYGGMAKLKCDVYSTGSMRIDIASGVGGVPRGRITEVFGEESSGKSTLCLQIAASAQRAGDSVLYVDFENALDAAYAKNLGVNLDDIAIAQPSTAEKGLEMVKQALMEDVFGLIIIDSVAAMAPRAEIEGDVGDAHMAILPRLLSTTLKQLNYLAAKNNTALVFINQTRTNIGVMYGDPTMTTGGRALKFYSTMRIKLARSTKQKDGDEIYGNNVKVTFIKNRVSKPYVTCEPRIIFGEGFSKDAEIVSIAVELNLISKAGSWYSYEGTKIGQGEDTARQWLVANPEVYSTIEAKIKEIYGLN